MYTLTDAMDEMVFKSKQQHMSYDSLEPLSFLPFLPGTASAKAQQIPIPQTSSQRQLPFPPS